MESSSTFSTSPSVSPTLLEDVESDVDLVLKLSLLSFAEEHSLHLPIIQFSVSKQENLVTSSWIVTGRRHLGNSFLFIPFARKKDIHKFRRDKTIGGSFYWKFVCSPWSNGRVGEMLSFFHDRKKFHYLWSVYHIHNISCCPQKIAFLGELFDFIEFP